MRPVSTLFTPKNVRSNLSKPVDLIKLFGVNDNKKGRWWRPLHSFLNVYKCCASAIVKGFDSRTVTGLKEDFHPVIAASTLTAQEQLEIDALDRTFDRTVDLLPATRPYKSASLLDVINDKDLVYILVLVQVNKENETQNGNRIYALWHDDTIYYKGWVHSSTLYGRQNIH